MKIGKGLAVRGGAHNLSNPSDFPTVLSLLKSEAIYLVFVFNRRRAARRGGHQNRDKEDCNQPFDAYPSSQRHFPANRGCPSFGSIVLRRRFYQAIARVYCTSPSQPVSRPCEKVSMRWRCS